MRHMANMKAVYTYEGTHDMHTLVIGQEVPVFRPIDGRNVNHD